MSGEVCEMDSGRFAGGDVSKPSTTEGKKYKLPRKLLNNTGAVNYVSVPRKLRSATKKRGRQSIIPPLPISRKKHSASSNGVQTCREGGAKKSRLNTKQRRITKDEEEVAETLYALADMFTNITKTEKPVLDGEVSKIKSSTTVEAGSSITATEGSIRDGEIPTPKEESREMNTSVTLAAACDSSTLVNSTEQVGRFQSLDGAEQPKLLSIKQPANPGVSEIQSNLSLCPRSPPKRYPACFENVNSDTQPSVVESSRITSDKAHYPGVVHEPKKLWKRCSTHVYIARLIKVLKGSERTEGLLQKSPQLTHSGGMEQGPHLSFNNQRLVINRAHGVLPFNGFPHSGSEKVSADTGVAIMSHKSLLQDQQERSKASVSCSTLKQGPDFLSLGVGSCDLDVGEGIHRAGYGQEALKQFHVSYQQPHNHSDMIFSRPHNGYSFSLHGHDSAVAASPQVEVPKYLSNTFMEPQQQKWTSQLKAQYNHGGIGAPHLANWQKGGRETPSLTNYAQALFPHLHSKYPRFSHPQHQLMPVNSSLTLSNPGPNHRFNSLYERNRAAAAAAYTNKIANLQLLCSNQHL